MHKYVDETGPVYDNNDTSNRYVHYIEMGEYPQRYAGTTTEISATQQGTYYVDNDGRKYALKGSDYYLVEPVRWIVIGVTNGVYGDEEGHVLFTTGNQAENESSSSGLWLYYEATNTFKYRKTISGEWEKATKVLVLSEYGLLRSTYKASGYGDPPYNHFSESDINNVLNDEDNANSLYNTMFTDNQRTKIIPKTMPITSYYNGTLSVGQNGLNSIDYNDVEYNLFLLGSPYNHSGSSWSLHGTDSYNIGTYFTLANNRPNQSNLVAKETAYSRGEVQSSPDSYKADIWWWRSGSVKEYECAILYTSNGVFSRGVSISAALRPAFVLDIT